MQPLNIHARGLSPVKQLPRLSAAPPSSPPASFGQSVKLFFPILSDMSLIPNKVCFFFKKKKKREVFGVGIRVGYFSNSYSA